MQGLDPPPIAVDAFAATHWRAQRVGRQYGGSVDAIPRPVESDVPRLCCRGFVFREDMSCLGLSQGVVTKGRKATTMNMNTTPQPDVALPATPIGTGGRVARFGCL